MHVKHPNVSIDGEWYAVEQIDKHYFELSGVAKALLWSYQHY